MRSSRRGYIRPRGNGFELTIRLGKNKQTGKYVRHSEMFYGNSTQAKARLTELLSQKDKGIFVKPGRSTLADYLEQWLEKNCKISLAPSSYDTYKIMIHYHINPAIGNIGISDLESQHIQNLMAAKLKEGKSPRTVLYIHTTLNRALKMAVKSRILQHNPVDGTEPPKVPRHEFKVMTKEQILGFLEAVKKSEYHALFMTSIMTGIRRSEMLGLRRLDFDTQFFWFSVNRGLHYNKEHGVYFRDPKTDKSRRKIPLTPTNAVILRQYREHQDDIRSKLKLSAFKEEDLFFCHWDCKPYLPNSVTHAWIRLTRRFGLQGIRLHDARHTMATMLLNEGVHPKVVQELLGHSQISTTMDTYSHVSPGLKESAAKTMESAVFNNPSSIDGILTEAVNK